MHIYIQSLFCFFTYFAFSPVSSAGENNFQRFIEDSQAIPQLLLSQNIERIDDLDIAELLELARKTDWRLNPSGFLMGSGEHRATCVYLEKPIVITCNQQGLDLVPLITYPVAALHEVLGANGYADENYELSLSLLHIAARTAVGRSLFIQQVENMPARRQKNEIYKNMMAGGSSVGGGGDGVALYAKNLALQYFITADKPEHIARLLNAAVEPDWDFKTQTLTYSQNSGGHLRIVIPAFTWFAIVQQSADSPELSSLIWQITQEVEKNP